ncbi:tyrosine-type recombinase/integrase [Rhodopirellula sp. P2]|uniref:tyrosine-type recombinase/integrase n=1 Tax=Rhodopirellula sp. P2 TaxID=2127060 RepID=UPI002367BB7F|nr:phage integrase SAM-like domain-containing protein [Rhodopirellula sp. P2]WDQ15726.1 phage integrase SAM-like domain-containing protein [Rhodopirellula sp. P2]
MATSRIRAKGVVEIRYTDCNGERCSLYPGKINKRDTETLCRRIEHIVSRQITGGDPEPAVSQWLADTAERSSKLYAKLVKAGLASPRIESRELEVEPEAKQTPTIQEWTRRFIDNHSGKPGTIEQLEITARALCKVFGPDRRIDELTPGDAEDFRKWLQSKGNERKKYQTGLAHNTVRRRIGRSKEMFRAAVRHELIEKNPFADEVAATSGNPERLVLVPADWIEACIRKAPCEDWRIMLAFARYGGMRSHETRIQKWEDIDLPNNVMLVRSHKNPPVRRCPIFPELRAHLMRAREMAPEGAIYVQTRYSHDANILTTLNKIITRAGLVPWEKPMQNLRATRETELLAHYPAKDVTSWLGNSPKVAHEHYAMTMQASFDRAVESGARIAGVTAGVPAEKVPQKAPQTLRDKQHHREDTKKAATENPANAWVCLVSALGDLSSSYPARTRT